MIFDQLKLSLYENLLFSAPEAHAPRPGFEPKQTSAWLAA